MPIARRFTPAASATLAKVVLTLDPVSALAGRKGYDPKFLGPGNSVPLPVLKASHGALPVAGGGHVLRYHNFSTAQSRLRRLPIFSACNVEGKALQKKARSNTWRYDPRIPTKYQIIQECYGDASEDLFSRGHMTRREDPVWGPQAKQAEADTFRVTNAVPQMQGHNAGIWLRLEDYVLRNAGKAKQRACVLTGPVLAKNDPVIHKVRIPVQLWKIVAFVHDDTAALAAVAYLTSQADYLPAAPAFVWGQFKGLQVPVKRIERLTGLSFGPLRKADVLATADATFALQVNRLQDLALA